MIRLPGGANSGGSSGGGGAPTGAAGGELAGTYPNPTIADAKIDDANIVAGGLTTAALAAAAGITSGQLAGSIAPSKITGTAVTAADTGSVTSTMILNGTILDTDVNASAAIAYSKLALGTSIVNSDISPSAAIAGSKISGTAFAPQWTNLVAPYDPHLASSGNILGANIMLAVRCIIPKSGVLTDITVGITTNAGNIDLGVYDCGDSVAGTYTRLYNSGSVACVGAAGWQTVTGSTGVNVVQGQHVMLAVVSDSASTAFARTPPIASVNLVPLPTSFLPAAGTNSPKFFWSKTASFPLPNSVTEVNAAASAAGPCVIARIV